MRAKQISSSQLIGLSVKTMCGERHWTYDVTSVDKSLESLLRLVYLYCNSTTIAELAYALY